MKVIQYYASVCRLHYLFFGHFKFNNYTYLWSSPIFIRIFYRSSYKFLISFLIMHFSLFLPNCGRVRFSSVCTFLLACTLRTYEIHYVGFRTPDESVPNINWLFSEHSGYRKADSFIRTDLSDRKDCSQSSVNKWCVFTN